MLFKIVDVCVMKSFILLTILILTWTLRPWTGRFRIIFVDENKTNFEN